MMNTNKSRHQVSPFTSAVGDTNDCTVHALANAGGISYHEAHEMLKIAGRLDRKGCGITEMAHALDAGVRAGFWNYRQMERPASQWREVRRTNSWGETRTCHVRKTATVAQFTDKLRTGRYIITDGAHAWAKVDGIVIDNLWRTHRRSQISWCFELTLGPNHPITKVSTPKPEASKSDLSQADISAMWERLNRLEARS